MARQVKVFSLRERGYTGKEIKEGEMKLNLFRMPGVVCLIFGILCAIGAVVLFVVGGITSANGISNGNPLPIHYALGFSFNLIEFAVIIIVFSPMTRVLPNIADRTMKLGKFVFTFEDVTDVLGILSWVYICLLDTTTTSDELIKRGTVEEYAILLAVINTMSVEILSVGAYWGISQGLADMATVRKKSKEYA